MTTRNHIALAAAIALALGSCSQQQKAVISPDPTVDADFAARRDSIAAPQYYAIFADSASMDPDVLRAMKFLYAYMPLPDITDNSGEYFKENVELALQARKEMPWGESVPEREFLHFVVPVRVNNENLDGHRRVFYEELKDRVKGMSMTEAILEVNHWCHEHVTYEPSDSRTHSPLASVSSGIGRCGEESTYTVAALRSIGIPARQIYTPRWAHTDDNHAWVEAWADGEWHFLGACEPEPVLDLAWFNDPATRGMLMNTRVMGHYSGPEEILLEMPLYTDVNVTANYAPVDTITITVTDAQGKPAEGANVDFRLYNYAEFYPLASRITGADGKASLVAGLGDLIVWVSAPDGRYAYKQVSVGKERNVQINIDAAPDASAHLDIEPPIARTAPVMVTPEQAEANRQRLAYEDSVRMAYVGTFTDKSRGNKAEIDRFLSTLSGDDVARGQALLQHLSDKDLTDVTAELLADAMLVPAQRSPFYAEYVLNPRVYNEFLSPFRSYFLQVVPQAQRQAFASDPASWAKWVADSIAADVDWQPLSLRMSPRAVHEYRHTNPISRDIFFVSGARAMGIPARLHPVTAKPQYVVDGKWVDFTPDADKPAGAKGALMLEYVAEGPVDDPVYYTHFTVSKIEDGRPVLLNFDEDATLKEIFAKPVELDPGTYMLVSGQRLAKGGVLACVDFFEIAEGQTATMPLRLRQDTEEVTVIGNFNSENKYYDQNLGIEKTLLSTTGRGYYVLGIVKPGHEPSNHAMRDIAAAKEKLEASGIPMVIIIDGQGFPRSWELINDLPEGTALGLNPDGSMLAELRENLRLGSGLPVFIIADTFNRVVFVSEGYTIGLGQTLVDTINKISVK